MTIYIKANEIELINSRKTILNLQDSFSKLEKDKSKFKILERERDERVSEIKNDFNYIGELLDKIEKNLPKSQSPYLQTKLTEKGISIKPLLGMKSEKDYLIELRKINRKLKRKK